MAIYLPGTAEDQALSLEEMTPREIVAELDKYVVGQAAAKRAVAVALRNRSRRQKLPPELAEEIMPKNILMIGSTGVGKTEIARRLAKLTHSPFLKVEASKFTEVGYVGRDVESIVRDLVEIGIDMVREEKLDEIEDRAELAAEDRLIELLLNQGFGTVAGAAGGSSEQQLQARSAPADENKVGDQEDEGQEGQGGDGEAGREAQIVAWPGSEEVPGSDGKPRDTGKSGGEEKAGNTEKAGNLEARNLEARNHERSGNDEKATGGAADSPAPALTVVTRDDGERARQKERLLQQFREGRLDDRMVELETRDRNQPQIEILTNQPPEEMDSSGMREMLAGMFGQRTRRRPMKVADAFDYLTQEEESRLLDMDQVTRVAVERVEDSGIVFLDEIDKIAGREGGHGPDISREGVQRDILPIVEGTTVHTKYGTVATDHILFVAAGAFHVAKPSDLIPELQGRFPIRVELQALTVADFLRILTEPRASLVQQAVALLETEGLKLEFAPEALDEMARFAFQVNETTENIGARRLHTILEKVLDEISFAAPELARQPQADETGESAGAGLDPARLPTVVERTVDKGHGETTIERVLRVDRAYVQSQVAGIVKNQDLSRYIL